MDTEKLKMQVVIDMLHNLPKKIPVGSELKTCAYKGIDLLKHGTLQVKSVSNKGVLITTEELKPFIDYLEQCREMDGIVIGIYTHSNNRMLNNGLGLCSYKDADFADINIITSEKTISLHINCITVTREIGHYVKVVNTSWKKMPNINSSHNRRQVLLERMVCTMASIAENSLKTTLESKEKLGMIIQRSEAVKIEELANRIKTEGELNNTGNIKVLDVTNDKNVLGILKTIYNTLRKDELRLNGSGAFNDKTYMSFEYGEDTLEIEMSLNQIKINLV